MESLDIAILHFCNLKLVNPVFDFLFVILSDSGYFIWFLTPVLIVYLWKFGVRARLVIFLIILCVAVVDPMNHYIFKNLFSRLRPCHSLDDLRMIVGCGGLYGFPSNHAANSFAAATILSFFYRRFTVIFIILAGIVGFSRIYLGKHYLSDVIAGAFLGAIFAIIILYVLKRIIIILPSNKFIERYRSLLSGVLRWKNI